MCIEIIGSLSGEQVDSLIEKLDEDDFKFSGVIIFGNQKFSRADRVGPINVKYPKPNHPSFSECPLPVGFILAKEDGKYEFELVNTDKKFPEDYHSRIREIYNLI